MDRLLRLQFIANVGGQFRELPVRQRPLCSPLAQSVPLSPPALAHSLTGNAGRLVLIPPHRLRDGMDAPRGRFCPTQPSRQLTLGVGDRLSIECGNHISGGAGRLRCRVASGLNFANHRSLSFLHVEELRVVGSHVGNLHSDKRMRDLAVGESTSRR